MFLYIRFLTYHWFILVLLHVNLSDEFIKHAWITHQLPQFNIKREKTIIFLFIAPSLLEASLASLLWVK